MFGWLKGFRSDRVSLRLHAFENARNPMIPVMLYGGEKVDFRGNNGDVLMTVYVRRSDDDLGFDVNVVMNGIIVKLSDHMREMMDKQYTIASHHARMHETSS